MCSLRSDIWIIFVFVPLSFCVGVMGSKIPFGPIEANHRNKMLDSCTARGTVVPATRPRKPFPHIACLSAYLLSLVPPQFRLKEGF